MITFFYILINKDETSLLPLKKIFFTYTDIYKSLKKKKRKKKKKKKYEKNNYNNKKKNINKNKKK